MRVHVLAIKTKNIQTSLPSRYNIFPSSTSLNIAQINLYKSFDLLPRKRCSALYSIIQSNKKKSIF